MKKYQKLAASIALVLMLGSCQDDFLDRFPKTEIASEKFFNTEEDLKMYIYNLYDFPGVEIYEKDGYSTTDNAANTGMTELKTMMVGSPSSATINEGWEWERLRTINFFLENFTRAQLPEATMNHFEGLARFFRARFYMDKVKRFSDVPWYDRVLQTNDEDLFKPRDPRDYVVTRIFEDYQFAMEHVHANQPVGAVTKWAVMAYMARHALYEGTFRKYHHELGLQATADDYLRLARDIALEIIQSGNFALHSTGNPESDYGSLFISTDLTGNREVILTRIHKNNVVNSGWWESMFGNYEVSPSRDLLQSYLMTDGSFFTNQPNFETKLFVEEFENRDPRLSQTFAFPGFVLVNTRTYSQGGGIYIQQLQRNFSGYHQIKGFVNVRDEEFTNNIDVPILRFAEILLIYAEARAELGELSQNDLDMTINLIRSRAGMPPMTLNPPIDPIQQARYPNALINTQWREILEIRRERRIELAMEGFRFDDLMRWRAGKLIETEPEGIFFPGLGRYDLTGDHVYDIKLIDVSESIPLAADKELNSLGVRLIYYRAGFAGSEADVFLKYGNNGTIVTERDRGVFIEPKFYYRPIPQTHVTINPNLTQIMGWQ